jgi:alkylation response protein AidB-like acyl-CoA dehydrogenase
MYFALTDEQREFDAAVRGYLADRFDLAAVRAVVDAGESGDDGPGSGHPSTLWKAAAEQGWLAVLVPEEHDGLGLGLVEAQVIARALGAGVAPGPWRGTVLAAEAIRLAGSDEQCGAWLPRLAAGDAVGAYAARGAVPGTVPAVEYGGIADVLVTRSADGLSLVEGGAATPRDSYDGTVRLADVAAGAGTALPGATADVVAGLTARGTVLVAADLVGIAREALTRTVAYDRDRRQFGVPVGSFQAIKHALADLHVAVTLAEHAALYAAHALDARLPDAELAVAVAKAKASDSALASTAAMIQYHGGIGYTWEHEAHLFYKRAKRLAAQFGSADAHRARIAELTIDHPAVG